MVPTSRLLLVFAFVPAFCLSAIAAPADADAVIRHCGQPSGENIAKSAVIGRLQRDLAYPPMRLHFVPDGSGWSFTTGWSGHIPLSRTQVESRMPCVRDGLAESEGLALSTPAADTTISQEVPSTATISTTTWGIPRLPLPGLLAAVVIILALLPGVRKRRRIRAYVPTLRRKPGVPMPLRNRGRLTV